MPATTQLFDFPMSSGIQPGKMEASADPWVFRDGRKEVYGAAMLAALESTLQKLFCDPSDRALQLNALIAAGEMESALSDAAFAAQTLFSEITLALADVLLGRNFESLQSLAKHLRQTEVPHKLTTSPPEGFSYYALHPFDFVRLASAVLVRGKPAAVIGIRSIGVTLSAVVAAQLRIQGARVSRINVRPVGHPYHRTMRFNQEELDWIRRQRENYADFIVVDEGPGRSGSTFLSVAEALVDSGVPPERITLLGSRDPSPESLCTRNAKDRWGKFRFFAVSPDSTTRFQGHLICGGGAWRSIFLQTEAAWPATWPQMERAKYLSPDKKLLFKFEGMGPQGEAALERAHYLASVGFGASVQDAGDGFAQYAVLNGHCLDHADISAGALDRVAAYCALRAATFRVTQAPGHLTEMVRFNLWQNFGLEWNGSLPEEERAVFIDGRMQLHEWIQTDDGLLHKTDTVSHGDDHFFPGPTSIAWDLAGTIVEWDLSRDAQEFLLSRFEHWSSERLRAYIPSCVLGYAVFRASWCRMALSTVEGTGEELRLRTACASYYSRTIRTLRQFSHTEAGWNKPVGGHNPPKLRNAG